MRVMLIAALLLSQSCRSRVAETEVDPNSQSAEIEEEDAEQARRAEEVERILKEAEAAANRSTMPSPPSTDPAAPPVAKLTGVPEVRSPNHLIEIAVSAVTEYKWKLGNESLACDLEAAYSAFVAAATPIKVDLSELPGAAATVKLCVIGKSNQQEQKIATQAVWAFTPTIPTLADQVQVIDGDNRVTLRPMNLTGNWVIIRSRQALTAGPVNGRTYAANDAVGNGTVAYTGTINEFIDMTPRNGETFIYSLYAINESRRYSAGLSKSITLAMPGLLFVDRNNFLEGMRAMNRVANEGANNRLYVCRTQLFQNGQSLGRHPGTLIPGANDNVRAGTCHVEYGGATYQSREYELLASNKGDPLPMVRWNAVTVDANNVKSYPPRTIIGGFEATGNVRGNDLYLCRGYTSTAKNVIVMFGKTGPHLNNFCYYSNNGTYVANPNYDVMTTP